MTLRVLMVEDSEGDAALTLRLLEKGGLHPASERVETPEAMREALDRGAWDIILSDYTMPSFSAPAAFAVLRETSLDIPFIIVSGTVGEEAAVAAMRLGVQDYFVKGDLARLVPAIEREVRERQQRQGRRQAELELRTNEARYRAVFEASPLPMWVFDRATLRFLAVNEAAVRHYGYVRDEFLAMTLEDLRPSDDVDSMREDVALHSSAFEGKIWRHKKKDGTLLHAEITAHDVDFGNSEARLVLANDVTQRVAAEEARLRAEKELRGTEDQLRHAQRMEAVGRLAGSVAHDFNNLLSVVLSYTEMILGDLRSDDVLREELEEIQKAGKRAVDLTRQLLAFSRQQVLQPRVLDLNLIVGGMEKMMGRLLGADVEIAFLLESTLGRVCADPGQLEQILMNLVVNSRDAMPEGGHLTIRTQNVDLGEAHAAEHPSVAPGEYVMLEVADTGSGIDKETLTRVFEPFFTTKDKGRGTGLGLSTVFGIVKQSGGHIEVKSELGAGTAFRIYLPKTNAGEEGFEAEPLPPLVTKGSETILLVEDDEQVRTVARGILRRSGYTVLEAPGPGEALLVSEQHKAQVDLLLTDVVLPRMSGTQLAERLRTIRPEMKVLVMSGRTAEAILAEPVFAAGLAYLQKPFTPETLTRKVREVLGGSRGLTLPIPR